MFTLLQSSGCQRGDQDPEPWPGGVCRVGGGQRAARDSPPHPAALRGQERPLCLCPLQAGSWQVQQHNPVSLVRCVESGVSLLYEYFLLQGLWRVSACDRCQRHPERGKPDQASDHHHPAGHREAPPLGSQLYLIFLSTLEIYFLKVFNSPLCFLGHLGSVSLVFQYPCSLFLHPDN